MPGLDRKIVDAVNLDLTLGRINMDVRNDMILAPHFSAIYAKAGNELWDLTSRGLNDGTYYPELPIKMEVPKSSGFTRPGTILTPRDRLVYQLLIDSIAPFAEASLDRRRVFSNIYLNPDPEHRMFETSANTWTSFQNALRTHCEDDRFRFALRADIGNYFERIKQHTLIGLLRTSNCPSGSVNLLEVMLSALTERTSFGIAQGLFPSDYLGNYYLSVIDSVMTVKGIDSIRYVDDIYLFFRDQNATTAGLIFLISELRKEGLSLNESKTHPLPTADLLREETEIDTLFAAAWEEVKGEKTVGLDYGFQGLWLTDEELADMLDFQSEALIRLYAEIENVSGRVADKIDKFCLPYFSANGDDVAVERSITGLVDRPYLASLYSSYLVRVVEQSAEITRRIELLFQVENLPYETQVMALTALLIRQDHITEQTVTHALGLLQDRSRSVALRGLFPLLIGKHGTAAQRRNLRNVYADEPSGYVQAAILFSTRYFPADERRACLSAWGSHNYINTLVGQAMRGL